MAISAYNQNSARYVFYLDNFAHIKTANQTKSVPSRPFDDLISGLFSVYYPVIDNGDFHI